MEHNLRQPVGDLATSERGGLQRSIPVRRCYPARRSGNRLLMESRRLQPLDFCASVNDHVFCFIFLMKSGGSTKGTPFALFKKTKMILLTTYTSKVWWLMVDPEETDGDFVTEISIMVSALGGGRIPIEYSKLARKSVRERKPINKKRYILNCQKENMGATLEQGSEEEIMKCPRGRRS